MIATIINYCSNERRFLKPCLEEVLKFSKVVNVVCCDHFFDGIREDTSSLIDSFYPFNGANFFIYPYLGEVSKRMLKGVKIENFYHCLSRKIGYYFLDKKIDYVLFLDIDEIVDGNKFKRWIDNGEYEKFDSMKLANYWYFKSSLYRAEKFEDTPIFVKKRALKYKYLLSTCERDAIYDGIKGKKKRFVLGDDGLPMVHHYSWVRTKDEMMKKVLSWGHKNDRDWVKLVEEGFSGKGEVRDFVHGYRLLKVKPFYDIDLDREYKNRKRDRKVNYLSEREVLKIVRKGRFDFVGILSG